ncbi:MAG: biopolymer transporter ExbD [Myxococcota bacterium]|nr:biopolymer transporter ExbD [Myxococcota bacterium]
MGAKLGGGGDVQGDINVTPLIDVVLVLLIIFMVLTPQMVQELPSQVPGPRTEKPKPKDDPDKPKQLVVAVYDDGTTALNLVPMEGPELFDQLRRRLDAREADKRVVYIDAHPDLEYGRVVEVMDLVKDAGTVGDPSAGGKKVRVGLARLKDEGPKRAADAAPAAPAE